MSRAARLERARNGRALTLPLVSPALGVLLILAAAAPVPTAVRAQERGGVSGTVVDHTTQAPLVSASVMLRGTDLGALTGQDGSFRIPSVAPGSYVLVVQLIGYGPLTLPDVIVAPGRTTQVTAELWVHPLEVEGIVVDAGYFRLDETQPASRFLLNAEEVRRAPGSVGDISRVLSALPSLAQISDNANDLFVRGGSPFENGFFIDQIQVPNINHFPVMGATGGPIGMLNVAFIDDVRFSAGGFSAAYGDRLSSIVDIDFRDGSRDEVETRAEVNMAGFGGTLEGPVAGGKGSWLVSARKSFLDLIVGAIGTGVAPQYGDLHAKASWEPDTRNRLSMLALVGRSAISFTEEDSRDIGNPAFGDYWGGQETVGATWRRLWGSAGYSILALSTSAERSDDHWHRTVTGDTLASGDRVDRAVRLRSVNRFRLGERSRLDTGVDLELTRSRFEYILGAYDDRLGNPVARYQMDQAFDDTRLGAFVSHVWSVTPRWNLTTGVRADRWGASGRTSMSPRVASSLALGSRISVNAAVGLYHQRLPAFLLAQDSAFQELAEPRSLHVVAGVDYLLSANTQLTVEGYVKEYDRFPLEVEDPALFVVDDGTSTSGFRAYRTLVDDGRARAFGVELLLQKKLVEDLYGLVSASAFRSRYRDLERTWRDRTWDNRWLLNLVGGYRFSHAWELSGRWSLAGGAPYTALDPVASAALNHGVVDAARINGVRYPAYHSLNLRLDHRAVYRSSMMTAYLSLWNVYGRKNVSSFYWNEIDRKVDTLYQWGFFPVLGMEWEF